jgi:DNA-binding response OmpR family regulator
MISASRTGDLAKHVRMRGANGYLPKPINLQQLRAVLRNTLGWTP